MKKTDKKGCGCENRNKWTDWKGCRERDTWSVCERDGDSHGNWPIFHFMHVNTELHHIYAQKQIVATQIGTPQIGCSDSEVHAHTESQNDQLTMRERNLNDKCATYRGRTEL